MREKAECPHAIVERNDDSALPGERRAVVAFFAAEPGDDSASPAAGPLAATVEEK